MPNLDDILGAQQDQIAEGRLELSQLTRNVPDLQECKTPFEVFCRIYEIGGENPVRDVLANFLRGLNPQFHDIDAWVGQLLNPVICKDSVEFGVVSGRASIAAIGGGRASS